MDQVVEAFFVGGRMGCCSYVRGVKQVLLQCFCEDGCRGFVVCCCVLCCTLPFPMSDG